MHRDGKDKETLTLVASSRPSATGHEHQFPPPSLSGRCEIRKRSFAGDYSGHLDFWLRALTIPPAEEVP